MDLSESLNTHCLINYILIFRGSVSEHLAGRAGLSSGLVLFSTLNGFSVGGERKGKGSCQLLASCLQQGLAK